MESVVGTASVVPDMDPPGIPAQFVCQEVGEGTRDKAAAVAGSEAVSISHLTLNCGGQPVSAQKPVLHGSAVASVRTAIHRRNIRIRRRRRNQS